KVLRSDRSFWPKEANAPWHAPAIGKRARHGAGHCHLAWFCAAAWPDFAPPLTAVAERERVDDFYAARSSSMPPLPWTSFSPPFSAYGSGTASPALPPHRGTVRFP